MNSKSCAIGFFFLLIMMGFYSPLWAEDVDMLFEQAEQKYLNFESEAAIELLQKALRKDPGHQPSLALLDELGGEMPETKPSEPKDLEQKPEDSAKQDTETALPPESDRSPDESTTVRQDTALLPADTDVTEEEIAVVDTQDGRPPALSGIPGSQEQDLSASEPDATGSTRPRTILPPLDVIAREMPAGEQEQAGGLSDPQLIFPSGASDQDGGIISTFPNNLNTIERETLTQHVGEQQAKEIITERNENGYYLSTSDLQERIALNQQEVLEIEENFTIQVPILNINEASVRELRNLPFMSGTIASNIVNFRFTYGRYTSVDDLLDVPEVDEAMLDRVRKFLEVR